MSHALTPRERLFVSAFLGPAQRNGTRAAKLAGYSAKTAPQIASRLLRKVHIRGAVIATLARLEAKHEITEASVVQELARLGFADRLEVEPKDKIAALALLCRHLGILHDKVDHKHSFTLEQALDASRTDAA